MKTGQAHLEPEKRRRFLGCGCSVWFLCGLIIFLAGSFGIGSGHIEAGWYLLVGWVSFLIRTVPRITWNWELVGMGLICIVGILVIGHSLLRRLTRSVSNRDGAGFAWPWRWTWCGLSALAVLFLVGMAAGGVAHQIGWMSSSPEPLMEHRPKASRVYEMRMLEMSLINAVEEQRSKVGLRRFLWDDRDNSLGRDGEKILQSFQILVLAPNNQVEGWIIFPRDSAQAEGYGGVVSLKGETERLSGAELLERLNTLRGKLSPL